VNKQHALSPLTYAPADLTSVGNDQQMRADAAVALQHMFSDAHAAGYTLLADSGYRSYDKQIDTYNSITKAYGQTYADTVSARPGFSEHQTGWAMDIGSDACHVQDCFGQTPAGQWAADNAYKYGFILRYPASLTEITGYSNETWHFRYVGTVLSNEMHTEGVQTLEQFFNVTGGTNYSQ
jgi:D-alanyl-D-alanine carboxypeptidase